MRPPRPPETFAAVDLGSNSFHLVVARLVQDELQPVDRLRERVALAAGLDASRRLTAEAQERALGCLQRFGERVRSMPARNVRAVGTSALRRARNASTFLVRAEEALGHSIEIVSGAEEARLIYLGVAHDLADDQNRRLVVDIGGGSTECILGERFEALATESLDIGCVGFSARFFPRGEITRESMSRARIEARLEIQSLEHSYRALGWQECIGSSGTIVAVDAILRENGWSEGGITAKGLRKLRKELVAAGDVARIELPGLQPERAGVLPGGVAILSAVFDGLAIDVMHVSLGAMREGVLHDLLGRIRHEDLRDQTIRRFSERYHVDLAQSGRVQRTALDLLAQVGADWGIEAEFGRRSLAWAARLHELGLSISHDGYHRHGAYIVENSDMAGFSRIDQQVLAALIEGHRRKLSPERFEPLPAVLQEPVLGLCLLLRLAVLFNRNRGQETPPPIRIAARKKGYVLSLPEGWLAGNPLTRADLAQEAERLASAGRGLFLEEAGDVPS